MKLPLKTPYRFAILKLLCDKQHASTTQIYRALAHSGLYDSPQNERAIISFERTIRRTLKDFYDKDLTKFGKRYLFRRRILKDEDTLGPFNYSPTIHGKRLAEEWGIDTTFTKAQKSGSPKFAEHETDITEVHLLLQGFVASEGLNLTWLQKNLKRPPFNPDSLFSLSELSSKESFFFFYERERSDQNDYKDGESGVQRKVRHLVNSRRTPLMQKLWPELHGGDVRVIFHFKTRRQQLFFLKWCSANYPFRYIWTVCDDDMELGFREKIFKTPKDYTQTAYSLLDIFPAK